jgi:signal transduction histidine kinase
MSAATSHDPPAPRSAGNDLLRFIAEGTAGAVGEAFFQGLVRHLAQAFDADVAFVAEVVPDDRRRARFLACWEGGRPAAGAVEYDLAGTPCAELADADVVSYTGGLRDRFPDDDMIVQYGLDSYVAIALRGSDGTHLGHLGVLAAGPLTLDEDYLAAMRIFAGRAAGELERRQHERALRERDAMHRALADEQAALRRVATLVAAEAPEQDLFHSVTAEVGLLLRADLANLVRYRGERVEVVAAWSRPPARAVAVGSVLALDGETPTLRVLHTGRPARADDLDAIPGTTAKELRALGIRSSVAAPINVAGRRWGAVTAARTGGDPLPVDAERRLGDFAELVAQAIANTEAREELVASRRRIVEASDAARRRIERNLHDGAQQRLVSLSLSLRLARRRLGDDSDVGPMLARAGEELELTLAELRELARGIHPAVLTERGLRPALEALAGRASVPVEVVDVPAERLPEPVESTAYYVVAEALTNVAKYADAHRATVLVTRTDDCLVVEVRDDGVGGADFAGGSGLHGLRDRVGALRGTFRIESPPGGGTVVRASIPVARADTR